MDLSPDEDSVVKGSLRSAGDDRGLMSAAVEVTPVAEKEEEGTEEW